MAEREMRTASRSGPARRDLFMKAEAERLIAIGRAVKVFENDSNRGQEAEEAIRAWLRAWLQPAYAVSAGEVIDSVEPPGVPIARQQDGIIHTNTVDATRFTLPSGVRLVPIEEVAATVEVKLTLSKEEFVRADTAAAELLSRQLVVQYQQRNEKGERVVEPWPSDPETKPLSALRERTMFMLFGYFGPASTETLAAWLREAKAISVVCCLEVGCVVRDTETWFQKGKFCEFADRDAALTMFVDQLWSGLNGYRASCLDYKPYPWAYHLKDPRRVYDDPRHNET
jgi:hypothetical protein